MFTLPQAYAQTLARKWCSEGFEPFGLAFFQPAGG